MKEKYTQKTGEETILDFDKYLEDTEIIFMDDADFSFLENKSNHVSFLIIDKDSNAYWAIKNRPGYGILIDYEKLEE